MKKIIFRNILLVGGSIIGSGCGSGQAQRLPDPDHLIMVYPVQTIYQIDNHREFKIVPEGDAACVGAIYYSDNLRGIKTRVVERVSFQSGSNPSYGGLLMIDSNIPVIPWSESRPHATPFQYLSYSTDEGRTFKIIVESNSNFFKNIRVKGDVLYRGESDFTSDKEPSPPDFISEIYKKFEDGMLRRVWFQAWSDGRHELPSPVQSTVPPVSEHLKYMARPKYRVNDPLTFGYLIPIVKTPSGDTRLHCDIYANPLRNPIEYSKDNPPI